MVAIEKTESKSRSSLLNMRGHTKDASRKGRKNALIALDSSGLQSTGQKTNANIPVKKSYIRPGVEVGVNIQVGGDVSSIRRPYTVGELTPYIGVFTKIKEKIKMGLRLSGGLAAGGLSDLIQEDKYFIFYDTDLWTANLSLKIGILTKRFEFGVAEGTSLIPEDKYRTKQAGLTREQASSAEVEKVSSRIFPAFRGEGYVQMKIIEATNTALNLSLNISLTHAFNGGPTLLQGGINSGVTFDF